MTEEIKIHKKDRVACNWYKACDYYKDSQRLKRENEALRNQCNKCKQYAIEQNNRKLLNENEKLKEENYQLQESCQICENFIDGIPCKPLRDMDYDLQKVINQRDKYIKALEEIKVIADDTFKVCDDDCGNARKIKLIIDKANEVLDVKY